MTIEELITKKEKEFAQLYEETKDYGYAENEFPDPTTIRAEESHSIKVISFLSSSLREAYLAGQLEEVEYWARLKQQWQQQAFERGVRSVKLEKRAIVNGGLNDERDIAYNQAVQELETLKESLLGKEKHEAHL